MGTAIVKRCEVFSNVFTNIMIEQQKRIAKIREMENLYNIVSDVVNNWKINNTVSVNLQETEVTISIDGLPTDHTNMLTGLAQSIQDKLVENSLKDPYKFENEELKTSFYWSIFGKNRSAKNVALYYQVPDEGTVNLLWKKERRTYTYEDRTLHIRQKDVNVNRI